MPSGINRRQGLSFIAAASVATPAIAATTPTKPSLTGPYLDLTTGEGNMLAMARINGDLDLSKIKHGWYRGVLWGFRPGEAGRDLLGIRGMSSARLIPFADKPGFTVVRRECGYYYDLKTGETVDAWLNPYGDETVEVLHIANPQINAPIEPVVRGARLYDDPAEAAKAPAAFVLDWSVAGDTVFTEQRSHLWAKNPLDPNVWKRESSGPMIRITDSTSFVAKLSDIQNKALTTVEHTGTWVHSRPWQPFMLMGAAEGNCMFRCFTGSASKLDDLPQDIVKLVEMRNPDFLDAPKKIEPSVPGLVRFMRDRKPMPVKLN